MVEALRAPDEAFLERLVRDGVCLVEHPVVQVELYGSLRLRTGRAAVPLHADTIRTAMAALLKTYPALTRLLPPLEQLAETHRFSINGRTVTTDLATPLHAGDQVILFSASVGG